MANLPKRVAIVYDWVDKWGGAERVLLTLHEMFPEAPLYTSFYNPQKAPWAKVFPKIYTTWLQTMPSRTFAWLMPMAFEPFNFDQYDLVISVSSSFAKGIITKPKTRHINYCLTPPRFLWSHIQIYKINLLKPVFDYLKRWDLIAANRPDKIISISQTVKERVRKYYGLDSEIIYPPVDINYYQNIRPKPTLENYFLYVGRLVTYKQSEEIVKVFNELGLPLVIIGSGNLEKKLKRKAKGNIHLLGQVSDELVAGYMQHARGLIFFHEEDFGIVPVEAMASGTPVLGLDKGGVTETVIDGVTGVLGSDLRKMIKRFENTKFDKKLIRKKMELFSKERFVLNLNDYLCRIRH